MPDWTYHPAYRPLIFRLPAEDSRRLTVALLAFQGRTAIGRRLFSLLSYGIPPPDEGLDVFGLRFPSPFGFGPGLDTDGRAFSVLQYLGCGFLVAGPTTVAGRPRVRALDRQRVPEHLAMAWSTAGHTPSVAAVETSLSRQAGHIRVPVCVSVDTDDPATVIAGLDSRVDFFCVGPSGGVSSEALAAARAATTRPILLRLALDADDAVVLERAALAVARGLDGVVVGDSQAYAGLPGGRMLGRPAADRTLALVAAVVGRFGPSLPVVAAGGVLTPPDAMAALDAGARLVEISAGWIYSGPGVVARSLSLRQKRPPPTATGSTPEPPAEPGVEPPARPAVGLGALAVTAWSLLALASGIVLAVAPAHALRRFADRVHLLLAEPAADTARAAGLALMALGVLTLATRAHVRRGERWPSWSLAVTGALAMTVSPVLGAIGLGTAVIVDLASGWLRRGFRELFDRGAPAWRWSAATLGRRCLQAAAAIGAVVALAASAPGPVRLAAGGSAAWGAWMVQRGLHPGLRPMWVALIAWLVTVGGAVGFLADSRGQAVWLGVAAALGLAGVAWLYRPLVEIDESTSAFPDI